MYAPHISYLYSRFGRISESKSPGGTPYIRMIGMIAVFLGVVIGDLVFLGVAQAKSFKKKKSVFVRV